MNRFALLLVVLTCTAAGGAARADDDQQFKLWSRVEFVFRGADSSGLGSPNPYSIDLEVVFRSPSGKSYTVPGFYDGDGKGGLDGNVWKVRFSADETGAWTYVTTSSQRQLMDQSGRFKVVNTSLARGFWKWGRLESVGTAKNKIRYFKFRDGPYWLKAGCDDPENFLGKYRSYDTLEERKAAVDYLASKAINSLYIMTHNLGGDDRDVWPWIGATSRDAMVNGAKGNARFDLRKLEEWRLLFEYMQTRGVVPYLVLEDDSAWKAYDHDRYWREMIARFGYLPAVVFNMGEEHNENYRLAESLRMAERFKTLDPFHHPLGIHNINKPVDAYIDSPALDMTAIQTGSPGRRRGLKNAMQHNQIAIEWLERCRKRGRRTLMINFDEGRPEHDRRAWWSAYLGGGVWEAHLLQPYDRPHSAWGKVWTELGGARVFMESLPFAEMEPANDLVKGGVGFCLAKPEAAYAVYLPTGGVIRLALPKANKNYNYAWWNPANGHDGRFEGQGRLTGGTASLTAPGPGDWALRIVEAE